MYSSSVIFDFPFIKPKQKEQSNYEYLKSIYISSKNGNNKLYAPHVPFIDRLLPIRDDY